MWGHPSAASVQSEGCVGLELRRPGVDLGVRERKGSLVSERGGWIRVKVE